MALTPNALRVLDHVGVYDRIVADAASYSGVPMINTNGEPLGRIVLGSKELYGYDAVRIYRSPVHRCLLDQALAKGIEIQFEVRVLNVASDDVESGVILNLADGKTIKVGLVGGCIQRADRGYGILADCILGLNNVHRVGGGLWCRWLVLYPVGRFTP
jgi:2-polyprenyl-6-methoxyphenol hydroxylase-like FAD-dependent oxidoreductase